MSPVCMWAHKSLVPSSALSLSLLVADVAAVFLWGEIFHVKRFVVGVFQLQWLPECRSELLYGELKVTLWFQ